MPASPRSERDRLARGEPARHRRARARREGRIDRVDVERQVDVAQPDGAPHLGCDPRRCRSPRLPRSGRRARRARARSSPRPAIPRLARIAIWCSWPRSTRPSASAWRSGVPWWKSLAPDLAVAGVEVRVDVHHRDRAVPATRSRAAPAARSSGRRRAGTAPRPRRARAPPLPARDRAPGARRTAGSRRCRRRAPSERREDVDLVEGVEGLHEARSRGARGTGARRAPGW